MKTSALLASFALLAGMLAPGAQALPLKKLVVYYSHWGSTRHVAQAIAEETGADLLEIKPKNDLPASRFWAILFGGKMVTFNEQPELLPISVNPQDYDLLFLGTPVWAGKPSAPMSSFFARHPVQGKKLALFCTFDGQAGDTLKKMREALPNNQVLGEQGFRKASEKKEESAKLAREWARGILP